MILFKQSGSEYCHSVIDDILLMVSQMFALFILLEIFEEKNRRKWYSYVMPVIRDDDSIASEVMVERNRVEEYMKRKKI